jgi:hypothetical protein
MLRYYDKGDLEWTAEWDTSNSSIPGPSNRRDSSMWIDKDDNVWIYGGILKEGTYLCDFWSTIRSHACGLSILMQTLRRTWCRI